MSVLNLKQAPAEEAQPVDQLIDTATGNAELMHALIASGLTAERAGRVDLAPCLAIQAVGLPGVRLVAVAARTLEAFKVSRPPAIHGCNPMSHPIEQSDLLGLNYGIACAVRQGCHQKG